jgi:ABC-type lipoprotein release transport system permease subunit
MAGAWVWGRAALRAGARSSLLLVLLIALGAGVATAAVAGARRTETAYDRFAEASLTATHRLQYSSDEDIDEVVLERLRAHPDVEVAVPVHFLIAFTEGTEYDLGIIASPDQRFTEAIDRVHIVEGRMPDPDRVDEVVLSQFLTKQTGARVGDQLTVGTFSAQQVDEEDFGAPPAGPVLDLQIVGVGYTPDELADEESGFIFATRAFAEEHIGVVGGFGPSIELRLRDGGDVDAAVEEAFAGIQLSEAPEVEGSELRSDRVRDTTRASATALWMFAGCAALAAALAAGQALTRRLAAASVDQPILEAIGLTRAERVGALLLVAAPLVGVGVVLSLAVAVAGSATMPVGLARRAEPERGVDLDGVVLAAGAVTTAIVLLAIAAFTAYRLTTQAAVVGRDQGPLRRSTGAAVATRAGWSAPAVLGITLALEPGRGRTAVPVRPALLGAVAGIAGVVAALTFAASLDRLVSTPADYGWNWGISPDLFEGDAELLADQEEVEAVAQLRLQQIVVGDRQVQGMAIAPVKGNPSFTILSGRMPASASEVVIGPVTADRAGVGLGDEVVVEGPDGPVDLTVVGLALFPVFDENPFNDSVGLHPDLLGEVAVSDGFGASIVSFRSGMSRAEGADLVRALLPEAVTIYSFPTRPPDVENLAQVRAMPVALAGFLVVLAVAAVGHALITAVRRRRRDLGVMRAIGFRRRQVVTTVAVQSLTLVVVGLLGGIPLGIIGGRVAWSLVADGVGVASSIDVPGVALAILVPAALVVGVTLAGVPAWTASRLRPAEALRTE